jgi:polysaccharide deacetylase family protein (PEP-CTERM system associated)
MLGIRIKTKETLPEGICFAKPGTIECHFLLSIDLEDIQTMIKVDTGDPKRICDVMSRFLDFLNDCNIKTTMFVVGDLAKRIPSLISEVIGEGHEIGCHSQHHTPLDRLSVKEFQYDLMKNVEVLKNLGAEPVQGFRAPFLSLTDSTKWAWDILAEAGFKYSSSVLPGKSPLYGWDGFVQIPIRLSNGLWELPVSVTRAFWINLPFAGGSYLRILPKPLIFHFCRWYKGQSFPIISYVHPYDIDEHQKKLEVLENSLFNRSLYYNQKSTLVKIKALVKKFPVIRYIDYVKLLEKQQVEQSNFLC